MKKTLYTDNMLLLFYDCFGVGVDFSGNGSLVALAPEEKINLQIIKVIKSIVRKKSVRKCFYLLGLI